jgi:hypothetical protein
VELHVSAENSQTQECDAYQIARCVLPGHHSVECSILARERTQGLLADHKGLRRLSDIFSPPWTRLLKEAQEEIMRHHWDTVCTEPLSIWKQRVAVHMLGLCFARAELLTQRVKVRRSVRITRSTEHI